MVGLWTQHTQANVLCVDANTTSEIKNGACWLTPYQSLQDALDVAEKDKSVDEIWVADGTYRPSKTYSPKDIKGKEIKAGAMSLPQYNPGVTSHGQSIPYGCSVEAINNYLKTFNLVDKVNIYGGFQGQSRKPHGEKSLQQRDPDLKKYQTILDGDPDGNPKTEDNFWHVLVAGNDITLSGVKLKLDRLVVRNGDAMGAPYFPTNFPLKKDQVPVHYHDDGGGLYVFAKSSIELNDMVFKNNKAVTGGAIFVHDGSDLTITNTEFNSNYAITGGAITVRSGGPNEYKHPDQIISKLTLTRCLFVNNDAKLAPEVALYQYHQPLPTDPTKAGDFKYNVELKVNDTKFQERTK